MGVTLSKSYGFKQKLAESYLGTKELIKFYKKKGVKLYSVENIPQFNGPDIDLVSRCDSESSDWNKIEVKVDRYLSGNFFLETMSNKEKGILGCLLTTKSNELYYYFYGSKELYIFDTKLLKNWIIENIVSKKEDEIKYKRKEVKTPVGNSYYTTVGYLVKISELCEALKYNKEDVDVW